MPNLDGHDGDVFKVSIHATNPDRLMHGEDPATRSAEQAVYWIRAYTELLEFKDRLLLDMESGIKTLSLPAGQEIRDLDVSLVEMQRKRYRARLAFWQVRRAELLALEDAPA
jgi:hypothetical protein